MRTGTFPGVLWDIAWQMESAILVTRNGVTSGKEGGIVGYSKVY